MWPPKTTQNLENPPKSTKMGTTITNFTLGDTCSCTCDTISYELLPSDSFPFLQKQIAACQNPSEISENLASDLSVAGYCQGTRMWYTFLSSSLVFFGGGLIVIFLVRLLNFMCCDYRVIFFEMSYFGHEIWIFGLKKVILRVLGGLF